MTKQLWGLVGSVVALVVLAWLYSWRIGAAETRGYQSALNKAARVESVYVARVVQATAKTDTVWRTKTLPAIVRAETLVVQVPESVRVAFPAVDAALRACSDATDSCRVFREQVGVERVARDSLEWSLKVGTVARHDSITVLSKRPTRKRAMFTTALTGLAAFMCGRKC